MDCNLDERQRTDLAEVGPEREAGSVKGTVGVFTPGGSGLRQAGSQGLMLFLTIVSFEQQRLLSTPPRLSELGFLPL